MIRKVVHLPLQVLQGDPHVQVRDDLRVGRVVVLHREHQVAIALSLPLIQLLLDMTSV